MLVWNDLDPDEKIKVYDKGVKITNREDVYHELAGELSVRRRLGAQSRTDGSR